MDNRVLVLLDTCAYEDIAKGYITDTTKAAEDALKKDDYIGVITDLSFVELSEGRRNLREFNSFRSKFLSRGFGVFGHSHLMSIVGNDALKLSFNSEQEFQSFKATITKEKFTIIKPLFKDTLLKYTVLLLTVLAYLDNKYFFPFQNILLDLLKKDLASFDNYLGDIFELATKLDEKSQKDILFISCVQLMEILASLYKPNYVKDEITHKMDEIKIEVKLKDYTKIFVEESKKKLEYKSLISDNTIIYLMNILSLNKNFCLREDEIEFDGTSYSAIMSGFCQGKYQFNDLVDIYNVAFVANNKEVFEYYTSEKRWNTFIDIEKKRKKI